MREHEHQVAAYNAAFDKLGLDWRWDADDYRSVADIADERERIGRYIERAHPHLLKVYDVAFLCDFIQCAKVRHEAARRPSPASARIASA